MTNLIHYKLGKIQNSFETYFQRLYSQPHVGKMEEFFEKMNLPKLTGEQRTEHQLAVEITEKEIRAAIAHLKSGKPQALMGFLQSSTG